MLSSFLRGIKFFTKTHEWYDLVGKTATVGLTNYSSHMMGDITFIDVKPGREFKKGEEFIGIESIKLTTPIVALSSGRVLSVNPKIEADPSIVNHSPLTEGWIAKIEVDDPSEIEKQMSQQEYLKQFE